MKLLMLPHYDRCKLAIMPERPIRREQADVLTGLRDVLGSGLLLCASTAAALSSSPRRSTACRRV